jgi:hypothetical protein
MSSEARDQGGRQHAVLSSQGLSFALSPTGGGLG